MKGVTNGLEKALKTRYYQNRLNPSILTEETNPYYSLQPLKLSNFKLDSNKATPVTSEIV